MVYGDGVCMLVHVHVEGDVGDVVNMRIVMGHHDLAMMMFAGLVQNIRAARAETTI